MEGGTHGESEVGNPGHAGGVGNPGHAGGHHDHSHGHSHHLQTTQTLSIEGQTQVVTLPTSSGSCQLERLLSQPQHNLRKFIDELSAVFGL